MISREFSAVAVLLGCYAFLMFALFCAAAARGAVWRRRAAASAALLPRIRDALISYISGSEDLSRLQDFARDHRGEFGRSLLGFQGTVTGSALERLCAITLRFSLLPQWIEDARSRDPIRRRSGFAQLAFVWVHEPCRPMIGGLLLDAVSDEDPEVRVAAARALLLSGSAEEVEMVFQMVLQQNVLVRALLAEDLRRQAVLLCQRAVPEALRSDDARHVAAILEMLVTWERAIPVSDLHKLLGHPDRQIRLQALRLAPLVPQDPANSAAILVALNEPDAEVNEMAAVAAGRLQLADALPALARLLRLAPAATARAASAALASIPAGRRTLEELSGSANPSTAAAATEALDRLHRPVGA
jgi:hypothetical protein